MQCMQALSILLGSLIQCPKVTANPCSAVLLDNYSNRGCIWARGLPNHSILQHRLELFSDIHMYILGGKRLYRSLNWVLSSTTISCLLMLHRPSSVSSRANISECSRITYFRLVKRLSSISWNGNNDNNPLSRTLLLGLFQILSGDVIRYKGNLGLIHTSVLE